MTFGVNHLGHHLLTQLLRARLIQSSPARGVVVSSHAHTFARRGLDFDDLQTTNRYSGFPVYCRTKLANIYFARELARQLAGTGVTANALHPGYVASNFGKEGDTGWIGPVASFVGRPFALSPAKGARTAVFLASDPAVEGVSGGYWCRCAAKEPSKVAQNAAAARRLWEMSEQLVASASS
jgi:NAD(P)-dependent dehydrogenase (short-subunit alcohol dehydrogenase family)